MLFTNDERVKIANEMSEVFEAGCFLGDFAREVAANPAEHADERSEDILLTFKETKLAGK